MTEPDREWRLVTADEVPLEFMQAVGQWVAPMGGRYLAPLLWQRGIRDLAQLPGFLDPQQYQPTSPFAFGPEMEQAVARLQQARSQAERVAIWGDFDADGVTATSVLWDGLGQFFRQGETLTYYIPNRLTESHGLSRQGLELLHRQGYTLIVTCDTGSTNEAEIAYAAELGLEVIVTDHHTLPRERPPVVAILNPRYLSGDHPLATLSGVAVAYKLVEALYETWPEAPPQPLEHLLDLVAIGLIADLVELKGDCRYLAQRGIQQLQRQTQPATMTRPGVAKLLDYCKRTGDRPTDISFGIGPRINAVSRIHGDAHFCVELLTSQDQERCHQLAADTELANARRRALQRDVVQQVEARLAQVDLSTTSVIVLNDDQWPVGVLGLVAGQVAQTYGRPTILLSSDGAGEPPLARGSARSLNSIDLYQLVHDQAHLLHRFGGHPYAAGLSLPIENVPLFTEAINQQRRQQSIQSDAPVLSVDLCVTVAELGKELFQELKRLEPCGMGNPTPRLLIRDAWFTNVWNRRIQDRKGQQVSYLRTTFLLWDESVQLGFPGVWWGHAANELPSDRCEVVVELDFMDTAQQRQGVKQEYGVRLIDVRPGAIAPYANNAPPDLDWILDWRGLDPAGLPRDEWILCLEQCPSSWTDFQVWFRRALQANRSLAMAYPPPAAPPPAELWQQLVGLVKYLSRTGQSATRLQLVNRLGIGDRALQLGLQTLKLLGFTFHYQDRAIHVSWAEPPTPATDRQKTLALEQFFAAIQEEQFRRQYFYDVSLAVVRSVASQVGV